VGEDESMKNIAEYILHNPVRKNLVKEWDDYEHSKVYFE
jgi:hypothetical protein